MTEEYNDKRLVCAYCGEAGRVVQQPYGYSDKVAYWVDCARGCWGTRLYPTRGAAISAWERHWHEPEGARGANA